MLESTRARTRAQDPASCQVLATQRMTKFADTLEQLESLCVKSTTHRNLKHKAPSVRVLIILQIKQKTTL